MAYTQQHSPKPTIVGFGLLIGVLGMSDGLMAEVPHFRYVDSGEPPYDFWYVTLVWKDGD